MRFPSPVAGEGRQRPQRQARAQLRIDAYVYDAARKYWMFIAPATIVVGAGHRVPVDLHAVDVGARMERDRRPRLRRRSPTTRSSSPTQRFLESVWRTFWFTLLATLIPIVLGVWAALVFHREFPFRGILRTMFVMPMMATPVAIALVWTMMFHPQLGVLNYLLSLVGIAPVRLGV